MVEQQLQVQQYVTFHQETTNQSFIDMHYILRQKGIKNNKFFLVIYDRDLIGVDPRDPMLSPTMKMKVLRECTINYWYFLREVVRLSDQGGNGVRYELHRGNLAMNFLFILNYNMFVELPRQHGKTTAALCRYLWIFNFGSSNSEIMFIHKNHSGSKANLAELKEIRSLLPSYLQMSSPIGPDGTRLKIPNTVETLGNPINHNKIVTLASAKNKAAANNLGRGATMPLHYYDEFAFILHNKTIYNAATPSYLTASANAKRNNAPYGILLTTTPGDLLTDEGMFAYDIRNQATPWDEHYYDMTYEQLEELRESNTNSSFFHVRFSYQQLGRGEEYFKTAVKSMNRDWAAIRREVLLEWSTTTTNCAFKTEELDIIKEYCHEPIRTIFFGRANQYRFLVYDELDPRYPPIIGVDVAGASRLDSSAITVIDSKTTKVTATLNCNFMPSDDLAEVLYVLVSKYMPNAIVNIERNGGYGNSVIQRLKKTSIKKNLYYEIKDKVVEDRFFNGIKMGKRTQTMMIYGLDSTKEVRARLIELLYERVQYHKDKFIAPVIYSEMQAMEQKKNGKVEHSSNSHDDQVFSYLMGIYVWYDGQNLMERFGIMKNTIKTDADEDEILTDFNELDEKVSIDLVDKDELSEHADGKLKDVIELIEDSKRQKSFIQFEKEQYKKDQECLQELLQYKPARDAYVRKYNLDPDDPSVGGLVNDADRQGIPDQFFVMINSDTDDVQVSKYAGNLGKEFASMFDDDSSGWL